MARLIHIDRAVENGARLIPNAVVREVLLRADGTARGVRFRRPEGSDDEATARAVVMAANAIETQKILLMPGGGAGIANRSGQVGQNLMDHPIALSYGLSAPDQPVYPQRGPLSTAGIESPRQSPARGQKSAFRVELGNDGWRFPIGDPTFEQLPDRANTVTPALDLVDSIGIPRPRITFSVNSYTMEGFVDAQALHERLFVGSRRGWSSRVAFAPGP